MVGAIVTCPLEIMKTKLQSRGFVLQGSSRFTPIACAQTVWHAQGWRGFWAGLGPMLVGVVPSRAVYFGAYESSKRLLGPKFGEDNPGVHLAGAATAGVTCATVMNPVWVVKTRLQLQLETGSSQSAFVCTSNIIKNEGFKALYKGLGASYLGISETVIQLVLYEHLKKSFQRHLEPNEQLQSYHVIAAAGMAKFVACTATYPHEVIRTRLREQKGSRLGYNGAVHGLVQMWKHEGMRGWYAGYTTHLLRVVPNAAILFAVYEGVLQLFDHYTTTTPVMLAVDRR